MMKRDAAAWRDLALFLGVSPAEAEGIGSAALDPLAYRRAHPEAAADRIGDSEDDVRWLEDDEPVSFALHVMLDLLIEKNMAVEFDAKDSWEEVEWGIHKMCVRRGIKPALPQEAEGRPYDVLPAADPALAAVGAFLLGIETGSDSYPVTLLPEAKRHDAGDLAERTGVNVTWWT